MSKKKKDSKGDGSASELVDKRARDATSAMFHQLEVDKINTLTRRFDEARAEKDKLSRLVEQGEKETHEFVSYFQRELEYKDQLIAKRNEELALLEKKSTDAINGLTQDYEARLAELTETTSSTELTLRSRLKVLEDELQTVEAFREAKVRTTERLALLEAQLQAQDEQHLLSTTNLERKFLEEKAKIKKEQELREEELKRETRQQIQDGLGADARRVIAENRRMKEELRFQQEMTAELQAEKAKVEQENKLLKRDLQIGQEKEDQYAKQNHSKTKQIRELGERVMQLEALLQDSNKKYGAEKAKLTKTLARDLQEQTMDAKGLRELLKLKNRELQHIRTHARTILEQRTEVESFFLEALDECKRRLAQERQHQYQQELAAYRADLKKASKRSHAQFPRIKSRSDMLFPAESQPTQLPVDPGTTVTLSELGWADRERVLRVLFAKINGVQGSVRAMPEHSLAPPPPAAVTAPAAEALLGTVAAPESQTFFATGGGSM